MIAQPLLNGSINAYFGVLATYCFGSKDDVSLQTNHTIVRSCYQRFIDKNFAIMATQSLQLDITATDIK
ncbi:MAG: hypothetical protein ACI9WS_000278 [Paraglaciecola psychrophila]